MVATESTSSPTIVIFGATGNQGSSVLNHLVASKSSYRIKAISRDPSKIKEANVQGAKADLNDASSIEEVIKGADYVFVVTNFWEHGNAELDQGKRVVDAIKKVVPEATLLWSGLPHSSKISGGKYQGVQHFDSKATVTAYARSTGVNIVDIQAAMYMENFQTVLAPRKQDDGSYALALPSSATDTLSLIHVKRDYGAFVVGVIESGMKSGTVYACAEEVTIKDLVQEWGSATGQSAAFKPLPAEVFQGMAGEDLTQMMQYIGDFGYYGKADLKDSQALVKGTQMQTWKEFVKAEKMAL